MPQGSSPLNDSEARGRPSEQQRPFDRLLPLRLIFPLLFVGIYLSHLTLLRLPYYWDEAGYYIPAAYDFFRTGDVHSLDHPGQCSPAHSLALPCSVVEVGVHPGRYPGLPCAW